MAPDFAQFLLEHSAKKAGNKPLFAPGLYDESAKYAWIPWKGNSPVRDSEIADAEQRLGFALPEGYRTFVQTIGPGLWADAGIPHPKTIHTFDQEMRGMSRFTAVAYNVDGCGNSIAFDGKCDNPQQVFFCNHDPYGYAVAAESFEEWITVVTGHKLTSPTKVRNFYTSLKPFKLLEM